MIVKGGQTELALAVSFQRCSLFEHAAITGNTTHAGAEKERRDPSGEMSAIAANTTYCSDTARQSFSAAA